MKDTYLKVIEHFGTDAQKVKTLEELSELQVEIVRDLNGKGNIDAIIEETADVMNMVEQICIIYDIGASVDQMKQEKMNRTLQEIKQRKTLLQVFYEKFPNAPKDENGMPQLCPAKLGYHDIEKCATYPHEESCVECWTRPVEEEF